MSDFKLPWDKTPKPTPLSRPSWELPPMEIKHDPALDTGGVDPSVTFAPAAPRTVNPLLVRDPGTGLWPGQQDPCDIPSFLRR